MEAFQPLYDRVLMEFITEEKTEGGLFKPQSTAQVADKVRVVAVGPGKYDVDTKQHVPMNVKPGDLVYVNAYLGMRVKIARGTQMLVQKEDEILGLAPPAKEVENG